MFGIVQHLRSARAGARPGDGTVRSLLDGELFFNSSDMTVSWLQNNGRTRTFALVDAESFPTWLATMVATLPSTEPPTPGQPWLDNGHLSFTVP